MGIGCGWTWRVRAVIVLTVAVLLCAGPSAGAGARRESASAQARASGPAQAAKPTFDQLYAQGQLANKAIKTLTARFTETTTNSLLRADRPIVAHGLLFVERPSRVALHYTDPADQRIVIDGKWMTTFARGISQKLDIGASQARVQKYFVQSDAGELRRVFDIDLRDRSSRPGTHEVVLLPKRKQIKEALSKLELWVGEDTGLLKAMRMTFANGDSKLMEFEEVTPNATIDPRVFDAAASAR